MVETDFEYWVMGNDMDSIDFMIGDKVVASEFLSKIVNEWIEEKEEYNKIT